MKKKAYIIPTTNMIVVEATHIIANSVQDVSDVDGLSKGDDISSGSADAKGSGSFDVWDDED